MTSDVLDIVLFDTGLVSENGGDHIIMDYCHKILFDLLPNSFFTSLPTHDSIGKAAREKLQKCDIDIVCGTNLLSSKMNKYRQWKFSDGDLKYLPKTCLLGVGWWQYEEKPNLYTQYILKKILSNGNLHSVRDRYTQEMLRSVGIENVIYTGCPTMWALTPEYCAQIPKGKAREVVTTFTDYHTNNQLELEMIRILKKNYEKVYIWPQSFEDYQHIMELKLDKEVTILGANLKSFDDLLEKSESLDYVGTRLHAGIRALNNKRRAVILANDNRAKEISKDTGLKIVDWDNVSETLEETIQTEFETRIELPADNIREWKESLVMSVRR